MLFIVDNNRCGNNWASSAQVTFPTKDSQEAAVMCWAPLPRAISIRLVSNGNPYLVFVLIEEIVLVPIHIACWETNYYTDKRERQRRGGVGVEKPACLPAFVPDSCARMLKTWLRIAAGTVYFYYIYKPRDQHGDDNIPNWIGAAPPENVALVTLR